MTTKLAVVTGSASGIGRATAKRLAQDGNDLCLMDVNVDGMRSLAEEIEAMGRRAIWFEVDFMVRDQIEAAFARLASDTGPIDILVNNVGLAARERSAEFWESDIDVLDWLIDLNLKSTIYCCRLVVPSMRERRSGRIISIASEAAYIGSRLSSGYSSAKAGVIALTKTMARELAPFGVNVNAVAPGFTHVRIPHPAQRELFERSIAEIPMGRMGHVDEIAGVVSFFAGPDSSFVTGQCLLANGGRHMA